MYLTLGIREAVFCQSHGGSNDNFYLTVETQEESLITKSRYEGPFKADQRHLTAYTSITTVCRNALGKEKESLTPFKAFSQDANKINVTPVVDTALVMFSSSFILASPFCTFVLYGTLPVCEEQ